jgi:hypothetical protein
MNVFGRLRAAALIVLLLVAGCSAQGASHKSQAATESTPPPSPAPSEALAPAPSIRAADDARTLLRPGGDLDLLAIKVADNLEALESMHVEESYSGDTDLTFSYDVDYGHCSGVGEGSGVPFRFVTTNDGRMLVTTDQGALGQRLDGRWLDAPGYPLADSCPGGPLDVALSTTSGAGSGWPIQYATRVGVERVAGRPSVHFRKSVNGVTIDTWVAAEGPTSRLMKLVRHDSDGAVDTLVFSQFDSADPVDPEPPADRVIPPGEGPA